MSTWRPLGPSPSDQEPRPVSEPLDRLTRRLGGPASRVVAGVFSGWEDLVGPDIAAQCQPQSLRAGVLTLAVDNPAWAAQLRFMASDLLARIREATGGCEVSEIRLKVTGDHTARGTGRSRPELPG